VTTVIDNSIPITSVTNALTFLGNANPLTDSSPTFAEVCVAQLCPSGDAGTPSDSGVASGPSQKVIGQPTPAKLPSTKNSAKNCSSLSDLASFPFLIAPQALLAESVIPAATSVLASGNAALVETDITATQRANATPTLLSPSVQPSPTSIGTVSTLPIAQPVPVAARPAQGINPLPPQQPASPVSGDLNAPGPSASLFAPSDSTLSTPTGVFPKTTVSSIRLSTQSSVSPALGQSPIPAGGVTVPSTPQTTAVDPHQFPAKVNDTRSCDKPVGKEATNQGSSDTSVFMDRTGVPSAQAPAPVDVSSSTPSPSPDPAQIALSSTDSQISVKTPASNNDDQDVASNSSTKAPAGDRKPANSPVSFGEIIPPAVMPSASAKTTLTSQIHVMLTSSSPHDSEDAPATPKLGIPNNSQRTVQPTVPNSTVSSESLPVPSRSNAAGPLRPASSNTKSSPSPATQSPATSSGKTNNAASSSETAQHQEQSSAFTAADTPQPLAPPVAVAALADAAAHGPSSPSSGPAVPKAPPSDPSSPLDNTPLPSASEPLLSAPSTAPVQMAQLVSKAAQSEMRIGLNTPAFGSVEVRTVVHASDVGVVIGCEKGDLRSLLSNDIPAIANTLQQQNLRLTQVSFQQQGFQFSSDSSAGGNSQPRSFVPRPNPEPSSPAEPSSSEATAPPEGRSIRRSTGLSILA